MRSAAVRVQAGHEDHPLFGAIARAPVGEPFTPEQRAMLDAQMEAIRDGRTKLVAQEDRGAWAEAHAGDLDPEE